MGVPSKAASRIALAIVAVVFIAALAIVVPLAAHHISVVGEFWSEVFNG